VRFYVPLAAGSQATPSTWNADILAAQPDLFEQADGFTFHYYGPPARTAQNLDSLKSWAWAQPGGNGKAFSITEVNLDDAVDKNESDFVAAMPAFVDMAAQRAWVSQLFVFNWRAYAEHPGMGFVTLDGSLRTARAAAFAQAVKRAQS
jgi:hypothetical protein